MCTLGEDSSPFVYVNDEIAQPAKLKRLCRNGKGYEDEF
jgi:hypothetical protein